MTQVKVWKTGEYWMYSPFFILHDWDKISAEARSFHLSGVALDSQVPRKPGKPDAWLNTMGHSDHASGSEMQEESLLSEAKRWIYRCILK